MKYHLGSRWLLLHAWLSNCRFSHMCIDAMQIAEQTFQPFGFMFTNQLHFKQHIGAVNLANDWAKWCLLISENSFWNSSKLQRYYVSIASFPWIKLTRGDRNGRIVFMVKSHKNSQICVPNNASNLCIHRIPSIELQYWIIIWNIFPNMTLLFGAYCNFAAFISCMHIRNVMVVEQIYGGSTYLNLYNKF